MPFFSFHKRTRKQTHKSAKSSSKKRRGRTKARYVKGVWTMEAYWKPIQDRLETLARKGEFKCVMCKTPLPSTFRYKTVMSRFGASSAMATTDDTTLIVRKFNLPSALRFKLGTSQQIQPTVFYFHCPYCAYVHQFKSSVLDAQRRSSRSRSSGRRSSRTNSRASTNNRSSSSQG